MGSRTWLAGAAVAGVAGATAVAVYRVEHSREQQRWELFRAYCTDCHNKDDLAGNVSFQGVTPQSVAEHPEVFEAAVRKLRGHLMPPPGNPQPKSSDADALIATLETSIDTNAKAHPGVGYVPAQRLNRTEYANAVKDLLDVDIDPAEYLPPEIEVKGFTNIAAALSVSPAFVEQYVDAASAVAHLAVGEPKPKVASAYFKAPGPGSQNSYVPGMPLGTRGGMKFTHIFPADGEYRLSIAGDATAVNAGLYPRGIETRQTLVVLVDRNEQFRADIGGEEDLAMINTGGAPARAELMKRFTDMPLEVTAGAHEIIITFIERSRAADDEQIGGGSGQDFSFGGAARLSGISSGVRWRPLLSTFRVDPSMPR